MIGRRSGRVARTRALEARAEDIRYNNIDRVQDAIDVESSPGNSSNRNKNRKTGKMVDSIDDMESPLKKTRNNENRANKRDGRKDDNYDNLDGRSEKPKAFGGRIRLTAEELVDPTKEDLIATRVFLNEAD